LHFVLPVCADSGIRARTSKKPQLRKVPSFLVFEHQFHKLVPVLAGVGAFLSFFHQGSLGGLYGVLRGRPFAFRQGFAIWPSTFFLFILSAIAVGPSFLILVTAMAETLTGRQLVPPSMLRKLGLISGILLGLYVAAKAIDTLVWLNITSPRWALVWVISTPTSILAQPYCLWRSCR